MHYFNSHYYPFDCTLMMWEVPKVLAVSSVSGGCPQARHLTTSASERDQVIDVGDRFIHSLCGLLRMQ